MLHLFLNNPGKSFYVREITRLIDEQINSVRRELSNMLEVGIITSTSADNKLYYEVNQQYEHFTAFRSIFGDQRPESPAKPRLKHQSPEWQKSILGLTGIRIAVAAGALHKGSASPVDLLLVGDMSTKKVADLIKLIEAHEGRELTYTSMKYDEFYYRLSVRDKFTANILNNKHVVLLDTDNILKEQ